MMDTGNLYKKLEKWGRGAEKEVRDSYGIRTRGSLWVFLVALGIVVVHLAIGMVEHWVH